ncbi:MAG: thiamine diphosphokinase [Christensenellales bacterium]|jgi:thiamine pyrophosphokinase
MNTAFIVGAGDFCKSGLRPRPGDMVIAADGGYRALARAGIRPDLVLGDMDSLACPPRGIPLLRFPQRKDLTDMALAIRLAKNRGCTRFKLYGALGGRLDHAVANLQLLSSLAREGLRGVIIGRNMIIHALSAGQLSLPPLREGKSVSVLCWGEPATGVTLRGLSYPLRDAVLNAFEPLGVSNAATGRPIHISTRTGVVLVFLQTASRRNGSDNAAPSP